MDRSTQLSSLVSSLERLASILRLDPGCRWTAAFESCLDRAKALQNGSATQNDLNSLSATLMSFFGGAGSFNDYGPGTYDPVSGKYSTPRGMDNLESVSTEVHDKALALRAIGDAI